MDVGCPKCQAEYELDDARVPESGISVKCSACQHVFRVKRNEEPRAAEARPEPAESQGELPPPPPPREWKIRQPSGRLFGCRELTTLQKWIIEGKVVREDEISLSGEVWKRLGDIPELASFFQVFEEASKARAFESRMAPPPPPAPSIPPQPNLAETWRGPQFSTALGGAAPGSAEKDQLGIASSIRETLQAPRFSVPPPAAPGPELPAHQPTTAPPPAPPAGVVQPAPTAAPAPPPAAVSQLAPQPRQPQLPTISRSSAAVSAERAESAQRRNSTKWVPLVLAGVLLGGGLGWFFFIRLPETRVSAEAQEAPAEPQPPEPQLVEALDVPPAAPVESQSVEVPVRIADEGALDADDPEQRPGAAQAPVPEQLDASIDAGQEVLADAGIADAGIDDAGPAEVLPRAGAPTPTDAGIPLADLAPISVPRAPEPKAGYEALMAQANRLRDREKAEAALDLYGRASDLKPSRAEPFTGKGLCLMDLNKRSAAIGAFEQALARNEKHGPALMGLAEALRLEGRTPEAIEYYQRYLDLLPNGVDAAVARNNLQRLKK